MAKFIDFHASMPQLPPEMVAQMKAKLQEGKADQFGATGLKVFMGNGQALCFVDAPNAQAVCDSHEALGMKLALGDVHEVQTLV